MDTTPTYFRPTNADTGQPTLATYFTAVLCRLEYAYQYNLADRIAELAGDVRDHLDQLGIPIRPTIAQGRVRILREVDDDDYNIPIGPTVVTATVMAFLTDAEPDDPRLDALAPGFFSEALQTHVEFSIPTTASEAELEAAMEADRIRGAAYVARQQAEAAAASTGASSGAGQVSEAVLDDLFG